MPVEPDDTVLDLGTGSGYALRALREAGDVRRGYGLDGAPEMLRNARSYADDPEIGYVRAISIRFRSPTTRSVTSSR